jgi:hypothetical protein
LLALRFVVFAVFEGRADDTWILAIFFAIGSALWLWPHGLAAFRKSAVACLVRAWFDFVLGLVVLWGLIAAFSGLLEYGIAMPWKYLLFPAGLVIWILSMAVMNMLFVRWCLCRKEGDRKPG